MKMNFDVKTETYINKPISDTFQYKYKRLQNGLQALLISDPAADKSAGSLTVKIGNLANPPEFPGLAHFCEHMLFMGTEKYPDENEYNQFLSENGGDSNAYTTKDATNYYFEVSNKAFDIALDKFAQFFISPLFKLDTVQRELKAVDSEHNKNKLNDQWRIMQLRRSESKKDSVFNGFSTGSIETLDKPNVREALIKFHTQYYSSQIMTLCVLSNKTIEELEKLVDELFSQVPQREKFSLPRYDEVFPYDSSNLKMLYKIYPINDSDELQFHWIMENDNEYYKSLPMSFLTSLFGHEGPNTLTSSLLKDDLIYSLSSSKENFAGVFSLFSLEISLTKKGLQEYKTVIYRVLKYIQIIQNQEINDRYAEEVRQLKQIDFDYRNKKSPSDYVEDLSFSMQRFPPEDILTGGNIMQKYDKELIKKYVDALKLDNLNVYFLSKSFEKECTMVEKWYKTQFTKQPLLDVINESEITQHQCSHPLGYPPKSNFIPTNFDLVSFDEKEDKPIPTEVYNDGICSIWYKKDNTFKLPKAHCEAIISYNNEVCNMTYQYRTIVNLLWSEIINNEMAETIYMANKAKTKFTFIPKSSNLYLSLSGFNSALLSSFHEIISKFNKIIYEDKGEKLKIYVQKQIQTHSNFFKNTGYEIVLKYLPKIISEPSTMQNEILDLLNSEKFDVELICNYVKNIFSQIRIEWIIQGNLTKEEAIQIGTAFTKSLDDKVKTIEKGKIVSVRPIKINSKSNYVYPFKNVCPEQTDSVIISFYQCGHLSHREKCILYIIENILKDRFFDDLRTKQGLGYIVSLLFKEYLGNQGIACLVQSSAKTPEEIWKIICDFFLIAKKEIFDVLSEEKLKTFVTSVLVEKKKAYVSLAEELVANYKEIIKHEFLFERKQIMCDILEHGNICAKEVQDFFNLHFIDDIQRLDVEYVSHSHWEQNEKCLKENNEWSMNEMKIFREKVESPKEFKLKNCLYPDFYNLGFK